MERTASLFANAPGRIDYLVPRGTADGAVVALISNGDAVVSSTLDIEPPSPGLLTSTDGSAPASFVQRVKADGFQSFESVGAPSISARPATKSPGLVWNRNPLNNEGFTIAPLAECVNGFRPACWSDDSETGGHSIRQGTVSCGPI